MSEKRNLRGWKPDRPDHRDKILKMPLMGRFFLPSSKDLRPLGKLPKVEDQYDIGSCTANACTSAFEYLMLSQGKPVTEMSRLFLYYATRVWVEGVPATEDSGAYLRDVMKALFKFGVCHEAAWPYVTSKFSAAPPPNAIKDATEHQIQWYWRCPSLRAIKVSLLQGYPVVGGFPCPESIDSEQTVKTGIIEYPKKEEGFVGGHAVLFVGYDDTKRLVCFENSWSPAWGDKGFGYLPYAYFENWLASDFWTIRKAEGA
jgi:C1A family cysteine protease